MKNTFQNNSRGTTLVELMVASAIGAITLMATLTVFNATRVAQSSSEHVIVSYQSLNMALMTMQRQLENTGYRFPGQSLQIRNNVSISNTFSNGPGGADALRVVSAGSSLAGILEGTDVIDFFIGDPNRRIGTVEGVALNGLEHNVTFGNSEAPMTSSELAALGTGGVKGPLVVFSDGTLSCLGLIESRSAGGNGSSQFKVRAHDFAGPKTNIDSTCPAPSMSIYGLGERRRFIVYQQANGENTGIYMQSSVPTVNGFQAAGTLGAPVLLGRGIEDVQLAPSLGNTNNLLGCGNSLLCSCGDGKTICTGNYLDNVALYRGLRLRLSSRGINPEQAIKRPEGARPASFDRSRGPTDSIQRQVVEGFVDFPNLNPNMVTPL